MKINKRLPRYRFNVQYHGPLQGYRIKHGWKGGPIHHLPPALVTIDKLESAFAYCVTVANERQLMQYSIRVEPPAVTVC